MKVSTAPVFLTLLAQTAAFAPSAHPRTTSVRSSALHMNMFDRFSRVAKANINNVLKNMEDPEKILNQAVEDMQVSSIGCTLWHACMPAVHGTEVIGDDNIDQSSRS